VKGLFCGTTRSSYGLCVFFFHGATRSSGKMIGKMGLLDFGLMEIEQVWRSEKKIISRIWVLMETTGLNMPMLR